jgi:hypothetical protein
MKPEVQYVALDRADGNVVVMQFVKTVNPTWTREGTDEEISGEVARHGLPVAAWRRIDKAEADAISNAMRAKSQAEREVRQAEAARRRAKLDALLSST